MPIVYEPLTRNDHVCNLDGIDALEYPTGTIYKCDVGVCERYWVVETVESFQIWDDAPKNRWVRISGRKARKIIRRKG